MADLEYPASMELAVMPDGTIIYRASGESPDAAYLTDIPPFITAVVDLNEPDDDRVTQIELNGTMFRPGMKSVDTHIVIRPGHPAYDAALRAAEEAA